MPQLISKPHEHNVAHLRVTQTDLLIAADCTEERACNGLPRSLEISSFFWSEIIHSRNPDHATWLQEPTLTVSGGQITM